MEVSGEWICNRSRIIVFRSNNQRQWREPCSSCGLLWLSLTLSGYILHSTELWSCASNTFLLNSALRTQNLGSSCLMRSSNFQSLYALPGMFFQWWLSDSCLGGGLNHNLDQSSGYLMWVLKRPIWCRCGREILREGNQGQTLDISFLFLPYGYPQGALEVKF